MKRLVMLASVLTVVWGSPSFASRMSPFLNQLRIVTSAAAVSNLKWKVGDTLNFSMQMLPLPQKGTLKIQVTKDSPEGFTMVESINLSLLKQTVEVLIDKDTGEVKKMTVNGKVTTPPDTNRPEIVSEGESHVTVPAGTFAAIHLVTENEDEEVTETWVNPQAIPISGVLKTRAEQGYFELNTELVSFVRGQ